MAQKTEFDVIVIGGGPGGYVAAIRASQLGMSAAVVEREHLGGICLNWGCIPTKALLRAAEIKHNIEHAADFGIEVSGTVSVNLKKVVERSRGVASRLSSGVGHLLKKNKVTVFDGTAKLAGKSGANWVLSVTGKSETRLTGKHIIIATGARARALPGIEPNGSSIVTYKDAMVPEKMPKSLIVVGSGAIGVEFASFYQDMGVEVTIVEYLDRILNAEDEEISALAQKSFEKRGIKILTSAKLLGLKETSQGVAADIETGGAKQQLVAERVIMAVGIVGNSENIGLEATKVKLDRGHIVTDGYGATGEAGLYAIGDVTGAPWLAHKASHEGIICIEKIAGMKHVHPIEDNSVPGCTYCRPQVASVGLTETKAKQAGYEIKVGKFPFLANGKAIALGDDEGLIKTIFDAKTGALLGAHMIGPEVTELIQGYVVARSLETTEAELMHTIFPHPTLSEAMHESVLDAYDRAIHF
ncbi:MAG: dihydrolipoyl dehydrogenase [Candidatus Puniceispirillaceae bacterium]|jgi:dihydrolipoamide dehydrogenase|nr:dihydrolipoyl dehydrogenase [Alphaproteobacteria bacterium]MBT5481678.1 dihydrolipoyl dehydrogenase [Alphaproteobacteria bacterium]MDA9667826.1 dihydrolipoyl dehydrogenase [Alphaproteobacteria bacterium]MDB0027871.1 dihydrolipoyl dehydrogenase [Alphaproteobacteria bacterium]MDG1030356.1 dihydrolipoyl dehydrogenase [Alphaproteobacteria bacterium]|tara:strand:- start:1552 stop:2964 length:1413 start_codon:yes stop_codon:yes gene_type:complete